MLETIVKHGIIIYAMGIMLAVGVFAKVISHITIAKMAKAASEIQTSNHKLMKLVKAKFEHASMVSDKVQNVEVFVKKYLYEYRVLGRRLEEWRHLQKNIQTVFMMLVLQNSMRLRLLQVLLKQD